MRLMSFFYTTAQMRDESKDLTRRLGWKFLKVGDLVMACVKCQGLGKGGKIERIHPIEIVSICFEPLIEIVATPIRDGKLETAREGFPDMSPMKFVGMFMREMKCEENTIVTRIEFKHRKDLEPGKTGK